MEHASTMPTESIISPCLTMSPVSHSHSASDPEPTAVPSKHPKQIFINLLTRQRWTYLDFSIGRGAVLAEPGRSSRLSMLCPSRAGASRLLRCIGARGPALLGRAAREAAYRPIRGPHPSRFITPQYPKPVSFIRRLLRVSQSSSESRGITTSGNR